MNSKLKELIVQGHCFNFQNNSAHTSHGTYSKPSDELLAWIAGIEHYLIENYEENSGPLNLFKTFKRNGLSGNYQLEFDEQITILQATLIACTQIPAKKVSSKVEDLVLSLIKNPAFWTVTAILMGCSFSLGSYFSSSKFDKEKNDLYEENLSLKTKYANQGKELSDRDFLVDSATNKLKALKKKTLKQ